MVANSPIFWRISLSSGEVEILNGEQQEGLSTLLFGTDSLAEILSFDFKASALDRSFEEQGRWFRCRSLAHREEGNVIWVYGITEEVTHEKIESATITFRRELKNLLPDVQEVEVRTADALALFSHVRGDLPVFHWKVMEDPQSAPLLISHCVPPGQEVPDSEHVRVLLRTAMGMRKAVWSPLKGHSGEFLGCVGIFSLGGKQREGEFLEIVIKGSRVRCENLERLVSELTAVLSEFLNEQRLRGDLDATYRRLAESSSELEALFESSPIGIAIALDKDCELIRVNPAAGRMLGVASEEYFSKSSKLGGALSFKVLSEGKELSPYELPLQRAAKGEITRELRLDIAHDDGRVFNLFEYASPLFNEKGDIRGSLGFLVDVTALHNAEIQLQEHLKQLEDADERKNQFIALLGHELRNPLAAIASAAQLLRRPNLEDKHPWMLEMLDHQVKHLSRLLEDLLDVARISHNKLQLRKEVFDLGSLVERAHQTMLTLFDSKQQKVVLELPASPLDLYADPTRIEQVILNLMTNAGKYSDAGKEIRVRVSTDNGAAIFQIQDSGIGMSSELLPRIFEPFTQALPLDERSKGGLGIGLMLVKSLVELHGGAIRAESPGPGLGSTFTVRLPIGIDAIENEKKSSPRLKNELMRKPQNVLVVDDNQDAACGVALFIQTLGHQVWTAFSGLDAVRVAGKVDPDVVFLDLGMPGLDGYEVAKRMRKLDPTKNPRFVALTGFGQQSDFNKSAREGFYKHLVKPVDYSLIEKVLQGESCSN